MVECLLIVILLCSCGSTGSADEFLAGHTWGQTSNEFESTKGAKTIYGCPIVKSEGGFSSGMSEIEHILYPVEYKDFENIVSKLQEKCDDEVEIIDHLEDWGYATASGYDGSIYYQVNYLTEDETWHRYSKFPFIWIYVENDAVDK